MAGIGAVTLIGQAQAGHKTVLGGMCMVDRLYSRMFLAVTMAGDHVSVPAVLTITFDYQPLWSIINSSLSIIINDD